MYIYSFEKLEVWQIARKLGYNIYKITGKFPETEKFGLVNQLRRASISVCSNIAEGNSRISFKEKAHMLRIAYSSLMEVINQLIICADLEFITADELSTFRVVADELSNKLNALYNKTMNKS
jgi:four helix bundle protein